MPAEADPFSTSRFPRTPEAIAQLQSEKPPAWEWLLFGGRLHLGLRELEGKVFDRAVGYLPAAGASVDEPGAGRLVAAAATDANRLVRNIQSLMSGEAIERSFGPPGQPSDALEIVRLADRWVASYRELLDWRSGVASTIAPPRWERAFSLLASVLEPAIDEYRRFLDDLLVHIEEIPDVLRRGGSVNLDLKLKLRPDSAAQAEFMAEIARLTRSLRR